MSEGMLIGLIFIGVSALLVLSMGGIAAFLFWRAAATRDWQPTTGQVVSSRVVHTTSSEGSSSYPQVVYSYFIMGQPYQSDRIFVGGAVSGIGAGKTVARYPAGSTVQVYYNPQHPEQSVLERRSPVAIFLAIFGAFMGLIFCGVGVALLIFLR